MLQPKIIIKNAKKKPTNGKKIFYEMEFRNARFYILVEPQDGHFG